MGFAQDVNDDQRFGWYPIGCFVQVEGMLTAGMVVGVDGCKLLVGYKNILKPVHQRFLGQTCYKVDKPANFNLSDLDWVYEQYPHLRVSAEQVNTPIAL